MDKLTLVQRALANSEIAAWYRDEHHVTADDFDPQNVRTYGMGGMGDIADAILTDAVAARVLSRKIVAKHT